MLSRLQAEERFKQHEEWQQMKAATRKQMFAEGDKNGDGMLDLAEAGALGMSESTFKQIDADNSGTLTQLEYEQWQAKMNKRDRDRDRSRGGGGGGAAAAAAGAGGYGSPDDGEGPPPPPPPSAPPPLLDGEAQDHIDGPGDDLFDDDEAPTMADADADTSLHSGKYT